MYYITGVITVGLIATILGLFGCGESQKPIELPIQEVDSIDIVGKRRDGGVDLLIVTSSHLTADPEIVALLQEKVQTYIDVIESPKIREELELADTAAISIIISCVDTPDPEIIELIEKLSLHAKDLGTELRWELPE
jgi:Family of unknown function (DUF6572)